MEEKTNLEQNAEVQQEQNVKSNAETHETNNSVNNEVGSKKKNKGSKIAILVIILLVVIAAIVACVLLLTGKDNKNSSSQTEIKSNVKASEYRLSGNSLEAFDLYFLQLENEKVNKIYSPLSIKYALEMLEEGTDGDSKAQISAVIGDYEARKYTNSENMSFANAIFIRNTFKDYVKEEYKNILLNKYNAEVILDSFESPANINNWISNKTFNLINNLLDDVSNNNFVLINALAIDMEWVKKIQAEYDDYSVSYAHEKFSVWVSSLTSGYPSLDFYNVSQKVKSVQIASEANRYDIVSELGEDNIRETVGKAYQEWLDEDPCNNADTQPDVNTYLDQYIKDIGSNYKHISSSTDFYFYDDENVKSFAKDLKQYNGTTLQYVGIMPKTEDLDLYVKNMDAAKVNAIINNLKGIELDSFKDGVITKITGNIPLFKFEYELDLLSDLKKLGITDVFDPSKANLSNLTSTTGQYITDAKHKANIEFSNEGIKAAAATALGGRGSATCNFDYIYEVPVEEIDLTFDKPYMFIIRDKSTGEVWFTGTVYEPIIWEQQY